MTQHQNIMDKTGIFETLGTILTQKANVRDQSNN